MWRDIQYYITRDDHSETASFYLVCCLSVVAERELGPAALVVLHMILLFIISIMLRLESGVGGPKVFTGWQRGACLGKIAEYDFIFLVFLWNHINLC